MEREVVNQIDSLEQVTKIDIEKSLCKVTQEDWEKAGWPLVTFASKELHPQEGEPILLNFWGQIFNPKNFISPKSGNSYDQDNHFIYILHSLPNPDLKDSLDKEVFKAVFTTPKSLLKNAHHMIKWELHGKPSEGGNIYPECKFWGGFFDNLPEVKQLSTPIPTIGWRKKFILKSYFNK